MLDYAPYPKSDTIPYETLAEKQHTFSLLDTVRRHCQGSTASASIAGIGFVLGMGGIEVAKRAINHMVSLPTEKECRSDAELLAEALRKMSQAGDQHEASTVLLSAIDDSLGQDDGGAKCDSILKAIDVSQTDLLILLSALAGTATVPTHWVPSRPTLYSLVRDRFNRELGPEEAAANLDCLR